MTILNSTSLECNKKNKVNFNGGDLSSDAGLLLLKEFTAKVGLVKLVNKLLKTNDADNLMQLIYHIDTTRLKLLTGTTTGLLCLFPQPNSHILLRRQFNHKFS